MTLQNNFKTRIEEVRKQLLQLFYEAELLHRFKVEKGYENIGLTADRVLEQPENWESITAEINDIKNLVKFIEEKVIDENRSYNEEAKSNIAIHPQIEKQNFQSDIKSEQSNNIADNQVRESFNISAEDVYNSCYNAMQDPKSIDKLIEQIQKFDDSTFKNISESQASAISLALFQLYTDKTKEDIKKALKYLDKSVAKNLKNYKNPKAIELFLQNRSKLYKNFIIPISNQLSTALSNFMLQNCDPINEINQILLIVQLLYPIVGQDDLSSKLKQLAGKIKLDDLETLSPEVLDSVLEAFTFAFEITENKATNLKISGNKELLETIRGILEARLLKGELSFDLMSKYKNAFTPTKIKESLLKLTTPNEIEKIDNKSISSLLKIGLQTYNDDFNNLCNYALKPLSGLFFSRLTNLKAEIIIDILETLMKTCYCFEENVTDICKDYFNSNAYLYCDYDHKLGVYFNLNKILWDCTGEDNQEHFEALANMAYKDSNESDETLIINIATFLSQTNLDLDNFWSEFFGQVNSTFKYEKSYYKDLYKILLNLKGTKHYDYYYKTLEPFESLVEEKYKEEADKAYKERRKTRIFEFVNNLLKNRKIEYQESFYDGFYFDFAIPSKKSAIVLMPYENYVFSEVREKQSSLAPKRYMEKKGWEVYNVPYFALNSSEIEKRIESILDSNRLDNTNNQ